MKHSLLLFLLIATSLLTGSALAQDPHDYLREQYDQLHYSEKQAYYRELAPMSVGAVYLPRPGEGEQELRWHFRTMKELGFTSTKQLFPPNGMTFEEAALIALEEGIFPWWYGEAGWAPITPEVLKAAELPANMSIKEAREHPKMKAYQTEVLRKRILRRQELVKATGQHEPDPIPHPNTGGVGHKLPDEIKPVFLDWVRKQYGSIDSLNYAYNMHHVLLAPGGKPFTSWADFNERWEQIPNKEYRHLRDIFRFKADMRLKWTQENKIDRHNAFDRVPPYRAGGEMGMFLPFSWRGVDMEGIAELMTPNGSFYPSIHLAWHFDEVQHEITRPVYMQAALTHDYFKGGWSATWESTGGPQQFSGGKGGNGFTVDEGIITQLMLTYLAAGYKGFGLWSWSMRTAGWEAGEYALLDRHNKVTEKAIRAGAIGKAAQKYRDEIWQGHKEPFVGVYTDWENEAYWAAMSIQGRDIFKQLPIDARTGVSRALINHNVPYEYVTPSDLRDGLAGRYRAIYLPFVIAIDPEIIGILTEYVENGGRVVIDMPSAWYDENGALLYSDKGTPFEKLFGVTINDYQYAGINMDYRLEGQPLQGFTLDMTPTSAEVVEHYHTGDPAITENKLGKGTAVILGFQASMDCFKPGQTAAEERLIRHTLADYQPFYRCEGAIVYRMASPEADHYFLLNDGEAKQVELDFDYKYRNATDAITGESLKLGAPIELERYSGRWLRFEK